MPLLRKSLLPLIIFSFCFVVVLGDSNNWELQKNKNGIALYTRLFQGSNLKEVLVVNKVKSSLSGIVALFMDTKNYPAWLYGCGSAVNLKVVNEQELYSYQITDLPWPFSDRDVISHFQVSQDANTKVVTFLKTGMPDYIPPANGMVRVKNFESKYTLTPMQGDSVKMELQIHLDPGGNIPGWLYNDNIVAGPYNTTEEIIKQLPKYQTANYSFIKEK